MDLVLSHQHYVPELYVHCSRDGNYVNQGKAGSLGGWISGSPDTNNAGQGRLYIPAFNTNYTGGTENRPKAVVLCYWKRRQ